MSLIPRSIEEFRSYVLNKKFTQNPSYYEMTFFDKSGGSQPFVCYPDNILFPGRNFINTPFAYFGPEFPIPLKREYNELSVNFIVYQDWKERNYFERWMNQILPYDRNNNGIVLGKTPSDILPDNFKDKLKKIVINFFSRQDGVSKEINYKGIFYEAYPILITPTSFEANNSGYTLFTVNFAYKYYEVGYPI